ncbi:MAG TPA: hypothetical protein VGP47_11350 [Parachlamydiaceae bacterium]|nr:hypothetical protein [Parachlamydiaceae bacterium]
MSQGKVIAFVGILAAGAGAAAVWASRTVDSAEKLKLIIESIKKKSFKLDHSIHTAKITLINFSANSLTIGYPSISVMHEGKNVGFSFPKDEELIIPAKGKKTIEIDFRINQVEALLSLLTNPKLSFEIQVITSASGVEVSQKVKYNLSQR